MLGGEGGGHCQCATDVYKTSALNAEQLLPNEAAIYEALPIVCSP